MSDGVVQAHNLKATPFKLSSGANSSNNVNQTNKAPFNSNNSNKNFNNANNSNKNPFNNNNGNKPKPFFSTYHKIKFTFLGEPLENALRTLVANKIITLPDLRPYEPQVKLNWWNDSHHCEYHRNKGHKTNECMKLKHLVQDLIDDGTIKIEGPQNNEDHTAFKNPFLNHEKGKSSNSNQNQKRGNEKVNFAHTYDNMINTLSEEDNTINVVVIKEKLRKASSNVVTRGQASKITLPTIAPRILISSQASTSSSKQYNLVDQLQRTPAQISILELLKLSPTHKEILEKALVETNVPLNLEVDKFQNMVGHLFYPHCLSFPKQDDMSLNHPQNLPLHIEVLIQKHRVKRVLIDGGAGLNICTLNLVKALGFYEGAIDSKKKIMIKAYDDEE